MPQQSPALLPVRPAGAGASPAAPILSWPRSSEPAPCSARPRCVRRPAEHQSRGHWRRRRPRRQAEHRAQPQPGEPGQQAEPVRRGRHRPARRPAGPHPDRPDLKPELVLAKSFEQTSPTVWTVALRDDIHYSDKSPVTVADVETAIKLYFQVKAGYVASQFPEQPTFTKVDDKSFTLTTKKPVVTLNSLMSNILITPAAANKAEELRDGLGSGPFTVAAADSGTGTYRLVRNENYWGEKAILDEVNVGYQEEEGAASSPSPPARPTSSTPSRPSRRRAQDERRHRGHRDPGHPPDPPLLQLPQAGRQPARQPQGARGAHLRRRPRVLTRRS